ncbi:MAG: hypothetical protein ABR910_09570 [Acidobacteriaceae bacterium]
MQNLWTKLEEVGLAVRLEPLQQQMRRQTFDFDNAPYALKVAANEAFFYLIRNGYIVPQHSASNGFPEHHPTSFAYDVTKRGQEWTDSIDPIPEDAAGYMKVLRALVTKMDTVIEQYVVEALVAFERGADFAAAVMLGAASEKALYLLADALLPALASQKSQQTLQQLLQRRQLVKFLEFIRDTIDRNAKTIAPSDGAITQVSAMFDAIRAQRNDAVHPNSAQVTPESVRFLIANFPYFLSKCEALTTWFVAHPQSLA